MSFCSLIQETTPKIRTLCFVLINSVLLNLLCFWVLLQNASSHSCFRFCRCCSGCFRTSQRMKKRTKDIGCLYLRKIGQRRHHHSSWGQTDSQVVSTGACITVSLKVFDVRCQHRLKPVLNWANVCSLNILRALRRTMIRFLIELSVRRIWFGQSKLYFVLNWLVMRCKLRPERAVDSMIENVG